MLTHTTHYLMRGGWLQQHYNVTAHDRVAEAFVEDHLPGKVILITGELDLELADTLIGTLPRISIVAQRIITVDGRLNPAASHSAPTVEPARLQQTAVGPVPHSRDR